MAEEMITIPKKELECLRKHLNSANEIFKALGFDTGADEAPVKAKRKVSMKEGVSNYKKLLGSGAKRQLPQHLKSK